MLAKSEAEFFDQFYEWRTSGKFISRETQMKDLSFLILFGYYRPSTDTWGVCSRDDCVTSSRREEKYTGCEYYEPGRCDKCITTKYYGKSPGKMKAALAQREQDLNEYKFYKYILKTTDNWMNQLAQIVGPYRIELFNEEMQRRGRQSVDKYVKKNPRENKEKYFEVAEGEMKYYDRKYIEENDFWSIFKETQIEGELLCSLLSDF